MNAEFFTMEPVDIMAAVAVGLVLGVIGLVAIVAASTRRKRKAQPVRRFWGKGRP